jgi:hypothetical protein
MKRTPILLLFAFLAWSGDDRTLLLAQETARSPITPPSEETATHFNEPPTPQFMQFEVDLGAGGPNLRLHIHPAWQALYKPYVRVGRARTEPQSEEETASPPRGGADALQQALEQALDRAKPPVAPAP